MDLISGTPFWPLRNGLIASYPALAASTFSVIAAEIIRDLVCEGRSRDAELFRFDRPLVR